MSKLRFFVALYAAKLLAWGIRLVSRERGTNLPGAVALKIDPGFIRHLGGADPERTIFVTGTNGKSTTTNLLAHVFQKAGRTVAVNLAGANLLAGVAVTLLHNAGLNGRLKADLLLLETDERFLPIIHAQLPAHHLCITNVQKDQVQRNGEPDIIWRKLASVIDSQTTVYVNNDEPNARSLGQLAGRCVGFGVDKNSASFHKDDDFFSVSMPCPLCHAPIRFHAYNIDNIGPFICTDCGFGEVNDAAYQAQDVDFTAQTFSVEGSAYPFRYSTPYFLYCYIAALAVAREFDVDQEVIREAFTDFVNIGGRMEDVEAGGKTIHYLRMKQENPETLQSALNVIAADKREKIFLLGLDELVDFDPHYTNTFYAFDCDFRALLASNVCRCICFSGTVAYDAALRLLYDGFPADKLTVLPTNDDETIVNELSRYACDNVYLITWLKKYYSLAAYAQKHAAAKEA